MRPVALLGSIALGLALGSLVVGHALMVPLVRDAPLLDPNLARTLAAPLVQRSSELLLACAIVIAMVSRRWRLLRLAGPTALLVAGLAAVDRFFLLPRLGKAWSRVDLVAQRPIDRLEAAHQLQSTHEGVLAVALLLLLVLFGLVNLPARTR